MVDLGVLTQWVPPELVARATRGRSSCRGRRPGALPLQFSVYFELALALFARDSYQDVLDHLVGAVEELRGHAAAKSSLVEARRRVGEAAMRELFEQVAISPVAGGNTRGARWRGFRTLAVDGFVLEVPDTAANEGYFGGPSNGAGRGRLVGYPQARVVTLAETGTRAPVAAVIGRYRDGEQTLAEQLARAAGPGDLVLFDRYYPSVRLWQAFQARGAALVMRADSRIARRDPRPLADGSYLARMRTGGNGWRTAPSVALRVVEYRVDSGEVIRLLTNLADPQEYPASGLAALYAERWQHECGIAHLKTHLNAGAVLRSRDPALARQEIWAMLTVNHLLARLAARIADERGQDPQRISFTKVLNEARRSVIRQCARTLTAAARRTLDIADDLRRYLNPPRRDPRTSPRTLKRIRQRYPARPTATRDTPLTRKTPPKTITLHPIVAT